MQPRLKLLLEWGRSGSLLPYQPSSFPACIALVLWEEEGEAGLILRDCLLEASQSLCWSRQLLRLTPTGHLFPVYGRRPRWVRLRRICWFFGGPRDSAWSLVWRSDLSLPSLDQPSATGNPPAPSCRWVPSPESAAFQGGGYWQDSLNHATLRSSANLQGLRGPQMPEFSELWEVGYFAPVLTWGPGFPIPGPPQQEPPRYAHENLDLLRFSACQVLRSAISNMTSFTPENRAGS